MSLFGVSDEYYINKIVPLQFAIYRCCPFVHSSIMAHHEDADPKLVERYTAGFNIGIKKLPFTEVGDPEAKDIAEPLRIIR